MTTPNIGQPEDRAPRTKTTALEVADFLFWAVVLFGVVYLATRLFANLNTGTDDDD